MSLDTMKQVVNQEIGRVEELLDQGVLASGVYRAATRGRLSAVPKAISRR